jgi:hypothetical protein
MEKKIYVQPLVEVLEVKVESGFAVSDGAGAGETPWDNY